ncbi:uncharacterized protein N7498_001591 [Penicillium cinerascens]|uniref:Bud22 domain-containing protein n=1 Tax=Penicillium cinerascens TaxID=70096 RepID=A0A9W9NGE3_9EURO|nr:uncharacterized protein N7498_001591 [Penicillium cinerascens]KAJ5219492.1 hypothetical protein N7498_001591 [Penicillium cinerascens]
MPKRKLSELNGAGRTDDSKTRKLSIKAVRLTNKFDQGVQLISRGLKTARGFERQKLSRREKTAKSQENNSTTLARLHEEVEALKGLDYQVTAERYLFKQLSKTKRIAESPTFKEFQESKNVSTEGPKSTAEANILARLFKSNPVKNVMPNILAEIRKLLGIEETPTGKQGNAGTRKDKLDLSPNLHRKKDNGQGLRSGDDMGVSGDDESGIEEFSHLDARLARGSGSEGRNPMIRTKMSPVQVAMKSPMISPIQAPVRRLLLLSAADSPPSKKTKGSKASATPATNTTFLPSLMMGGYWSGSEEATDDEARGCWATKAQEPNGPASAARTVGEEIWHQGESRTSRNRRSTRIIETADGILGGEQSADDRGCQRLPRWERWILELVPAARQTDKMAVQAPLELSIRTKG